MIVVRLPAAPGPLRDEGARLRRRIEAAWSGEGPIVLDFQSRRIASISFLDEAIAALVEAHDLGEVRQRLELRNMVPGDRRLLETLFEKRAARRPATPRAAS